MFLTAKKLDCKKKTSTSPNRREIPLIRKTGCCTTEREERQRDRQREKEGGRTQCFMNKKDPSLIDVEHVEITGARCCHLIWRTPLNSSFIYLFHLFTQGKPKQLTLVFIGALHTFHVVTNMYVQFKHNTIQSNLREYDAYLNITCIISHNQACTVMGTNVFIVYVHRNEGHFIYMYVYHTNVFEADSYKYPPEMSFHIPPQSKIILATPVEWRSQRGRHVGYGPLQRFVNVFFSN